jgi:predicted membrane protein
MLILSYLSCINNYTTMSILSRSRNYGFGILLMVLGSFLLLDQFGYADFGYLIGMLWPCILIYFGLRLLLKTRVVAGIGVLAVGTLFLLQNFNLVNEGIFRVFWPIFLIFLGAFILVRPRNTSPITRYTSSNRTTVERSQWNDIHSFFAGIDNILLVDPFVGGSISGNFSGIKLDLSRCVIGEKAVLDLDLNFSGLELTVPKDWKVVSEVSPFAGGISDERGNSALIDSAKELIIRGNVAFSGVHIT